MGRLAAAGAARRRRRRTNWGFFASSVAFMPCPTTCAADCEPTKSVTRAAAGDVRRAHRLTSVPWRTSRRLAGAKPRRNTGPAPLSPEGCAAERGCEAGRVNQAWLRARSGVITHTAPLVRGKVHSWRDCPTRLAVQRSELPQEPIVHVRHQPRERVEVPIRRPGSVGPFPSEPVTAFQRAHLGDQRTQRLRTHPSYFSRSSGRSTSRRICPPALPEAEARVLSCLRA